MRGRAGLVAVLAFGLLAAPAHADHFFVDPASSTEGSPCNSSANACHTIFGAISQARSTSGGDLITVAAGTYSETVVLNNPNDTGDEIAGAGSGPGGTVIQHDGSVNGQERSLGGANGGDQATGLLVHDLRVVVPVGAGTDKLGVALQDSN